MLKNGTTEAYYYYLFNAQGDVIGIIDNQGTQVVEYTYSPWGELLSITGTLKDTIGVKNPLRYRGYYYDSETGFYYLQSRYYDPVVQRFLNADAVVSGVGTSIHGYNLFAYAFNNPVNMDDSEGNWPKWIKKAVKKVATAVKKVVKAGKKVVKKLSKTIDKTASAFTIELGIGMGLKGSADVGGVELSGGFKSDSITIILNSEDSRIGQRIESDLKVGVGPFELGPSQSDWIPISKNDMYSSDSSWCDAEPVIEFGGEVYLFYGFTLNISVDLEVIKEGLVILFEK